MRTEMRICFDFDAMCEIIKLCKIYVFIITGAVVIVRGDFKYNRSERRGFRHGDVVIILRERGWAVVNIW